MQEHIKTFPASLVGGGGGGGGGGGEEVYVLLTYVTQEVIHHVTCKFDWHIHRAYI